MLLFEKNFHVSTRMETGYNATHYLRVSTWEIARSKFEVIKISNVKVFVDFIFVRRGIIRNIRKFVPIQNFTPYGMYEFAISCMDNNYNYNFNIFKSMIIRLLGVRMRIMPRARYWNSMNNHVFIPK